MILVKGAQGFRTTGHMDPAGGKIVLGLSWPPSIYKNILCSLFLPILDLEEKEGGKPYDFATANQGEIQSVNEFM